MYTYEIQHIDWNFNSITIHINVSNYNQGMIVKPIDQFSYARYSRRGEMKLNSLLSHIFQNDKLNVVEELQHKNNKSLVQFIYILFSIVQTRQLMSIYRKITPGK
jgi:hypothetical protein